jgi:tetratricopeptide (TPR) repeat protein
MRADPSHHRLGLFAIISLMAVSACATTNTRSTTATNPNLVRRFVLDYEHVPVAPDGLPADVRRAWDALRDGDSATAGQMLDLAPAASRSTAGGSAADGFLMLARGATAEARTRFQQALAVSPGYATALYGLGFVAEAEGNRIAGLDWYQQAVEADPSLSPPSVRLQVLRLERAQALIAEGERAEARGDDAGAVSSYEAALELGPDVLEPYLRIAAIQRRRDQDEEAIRTLRAARDRIGDLRIVLEPLGQTLQRSGAYADAYDVFQALENMAPNDPDVSAMVASARELYFTTSLPEPYRELEDKRQIAREDLAALIAIRLPNLGELVEEPRTGVIIVDIESTWAEDYIREVVEWGVMQVFQNHAFGPELVIKRQFFAEVAYRVLEVLDATEGAPRAQLSDVPTEHYFYEQIRVVVGQGILPVGPRGGFGLLEPVSGAEAVAAVQRLVRLARSQGGR